MKRTGATSPPSSRFPLSPLTSAQEKQFRLKGAALLTKAIQDCERTLSNIDGEWKYVRMHQGLKVYKAKTPHAPSELMVTGIARGTLHDIMNCTYAPDSFNFRLQSALLMPKEHLDCEVLHAIDTQIEDHPYRFNGIKWCATKWPGGTMNKTRDMCYFESTGITQARDSHGQLLEYGYNIMESIDLPQCPNLDLYSIVRAKISLRHIFRELPIGCTMVMTHCTVDPSGSLPSWMSDFSTLPHLLAISRAVDVAESIRLSKAMLDDGKHPSSKGRVAFLAKAECALCDKGNEFKLEKKRVVEVAGAGVKTTTRYFCPPCLAQAVMMPPPPHHLPDLVDVAYVNGEHSLVSKPSSTTLYSDDLSNDDMSELSSIAEDMMPPPPPILDFDDDDADESVYSGLDFDYRETCVSSHTSQDTTIPFSPCTSSEVSPSVLAQQLVQLNLQMDNTYDILRRNRVRMNSLQSTASST
ncbi:Aste57867_15920 [Aphanomyces stellatus]|uniref:Aste57867_15920 protein n=1 Tax=Aphanomyces stellatus TaxID=120398 RepID=A0A485L597_9STRA|nr:hypothetical protein As57867_015864 [Aphanomyces stellatus]VFT92706.1 Aste57867_15920 [Aphanomyces stellatus]